WRGRQLHRRTRPDAPGPAPSGAPPRRAGAGRSAPRRLSPVARPRAPDVPRALPPSATAARSSVVRRSGGTEGAWECGWRRDEGQDSATGCDSYGTPLTECTQSAPGRTPILLKKPRKNGLNSHRHYNTAVPVVLAAFNDAGAQCVLEFEHHGLVFDGCERVQ